MSDFHLTLATFSPREAEAITGLQQARQRDLRRHGYLPRHDGRAAFDAAELAHMMGLSLMIGRGIAPATANEIAKIAAVPITQAALDHPEAYSELDRAEWSYPGEQTAKGKAEWLAQVTKFQLARERKSDIWRLQVGPYLIVFADGSEVFHISLEAALAEIADDDPRRIGAITVFDLKALGNELAKRARRALVHVT